MALVSSEELAKDVASAEALLDRHQVRSFYRQWLCFEDEFVDSNRSDSNRFSVESKQVKTENSNSNYLGQKETVKARKYPSEKKEDIGGRRYLSGTRENSLSKARIICENEKQATENVRRRSYLLVRDVPEAELILDYHKVCN
mgnify:CR=1 FL=1